MITIEDLGRMADEYAKEIAPDNKEEQTAISADSLGFLNKVMEKCFLVEESEVQELYNSYCAERDKEEPGSNRSSLGGRIAMLQELFGSKCLPDNVDSLSQNPPKNCDNGNLISTDDIQLDNILKDSFRNERRLNIATQMVKAIMQCHGIVERIASAEADSLLDDILHDALYLTDRLMSECEKGGMK